jgi:hypothetical protein
VSNLAGSALAIGRPNHAAEAAEAAVHFKKSRRFMSRPPEQLLVTFFTRHDL